MTVDIFKKIFLLSFAAAVVFALGPATAGAKNLDGTPAAGVKGGVVSLEVAQNTAGGSGSASPNQSSGGSGSGRTVSSSSSSSSTGNGFKEIDVGGMKNQPLNVRLKHDENIKILWTTILHLADGLVALFFVAVALATILHINYDTYSVKKAIPPLLIGIVLAHFSRPIIYAFVDFAQILTAEFFNLVAGGGGAQGFAANLSSAIFIGGAGGLSNAVSAATFSAIFGLVAFVGVTVIAATGGTAAPLMFVGMVLIALIIILIPTVLLAILSFLLYARFYILMFLTIISPVAWLTMAWAPIQGFFKKWWSQFTMWVFMAPVVMFFLWLAVSFYQASTNGGKANFGTYLLSLLMVYLAIKAPFTMGGAVIAAYASIGKRTAGAAWQKGINPAAGRALDKIALTRWGRTFHIMSGAAMKQGLKDKFGRAAEMDRYRASRGISGRDLTIPMPGRGWRERVGEKIRNSWRRDHRQNDPGARAIERRMLEENHHLSDSSTGDIAERIRNRQIPPADLEGVALSVAERGDDIEQIIEAIRQGFGEAMAGEVRGRVQERADDMYQRTKPWLRSDANSPDPQVRAAVERDILAWKSGENFSSQSTNSDFAQIGRLGNNWRGAVDALGNLQRNVDPARRQEIQGEIDRINRYQGDAFRTHIVFNNENENNAYNAGNISALLRNLNETDRRIARRAGAGSAVQDALDQFAGRQGQQEGGGGEDSDTSSILGPDGNPYRRS